MKTKDFIKSMIKPFYSQKGSNEADLQRIAAQEQKQFSYETLSKATDKFHPSRKLGEGGFGPVFKRNSSYNQAFEAQNLLEWAYKLFKKGKSVEVLDASIAATEYAEQVALCVQIGLLCTQSDPNLRPSMRRVVLLLSKKTTSLDEPTRPGFPGSRYRRSRHPGASSSNTGSSGASSTTKADYTTSTMTVTANTPIARSLGSDPLGKRPVE
ncbi:hypothetical protein BVRB_6g144300 isoform B [Beta vulgaris subsp. vulgaris]|nr:hypothetical protein BVRB_6g144300 isoform B [Beta vulgaris subsp. vulgaris]